eukprot:TRINITY_DN4279_c4_g1_i1.p1 TRINITY_DN4279_c4_g1~~TRINITY_DN4279_c4_g1_i1.p1  ORF type:complete len:295 (+),score=48.95 TRINITY_DN4279_c4_g1_i1:54-887(+)
MTEAYRTIPQEKVEKQEEFFVCPEWAGHPSKGTHLEVRKAGKVVDVILIDKMPYYLAGRLQAVVDIPLEHKSTSRAHCVFVHHRKGSVYLIDLASGHGVFVNDKKIPSKKTVKISEDDEVRVGASTRVLKLSRKPPQNLENAKILEDNRGDPPAKRAKLETVHIYHILLKHRESRNPKSFRDPVNPVKRSKGDAIERLMELKEVIARNENPFDELKRYAKKYSDCSSAKAGGDIGHISKGKMLKEVEEAAFRLKQGTISNPVCSDSGVHILYRVPKE